MNEWAKGPDGRRRAVRVRGPRGGEVSFLLDGRALLVCGVLVALTLATAAVSLSTGEFRIPLPEVVRTLTGGGTSADHFVIDTLRLPRLLTAVLVGAALGAGGAVFQSLSRNPLGSPDVVGFDTGAATGALLVILVAHGSRAEIAAGAAVGGVGTALAVYLLAMRRGVQGARLVLIGIAIAAMLGSVNSYLLSRADVSDAQTAYLWLIGSLNSSDWPGVTAIGVTLAVLLPAAVRLGRGLNALEMGDDLACALGVRPERVRFAAVVAGVGLTAVATSCAGPIAFIALSAPQIARRLTGVPGPNVLPAALTGALLLSACDWIAQQGFTGTQLPVGVLTSVVGGGYLAWLLAREWRGGRG
ncbi:iron chelate uptake ABC transporter family permease subunit [Streptomyces sp. PTM05]|uniref:Iron chelate uptake ABC transporter family permease subunit n=1 Tax=Streptantibioticus parmotrematis TaxID=2873249 RepID=A0ABS7QUD4_9ACTN|nr:iron chelate uptake ABC transporter family permease subunit [Streptantibioticus parmotrematis]